MRYKPYTTPSQNTLHKKFKIRVMIISWSMYYDFPDRDFKDFKDSVWKVIE